MRRPAGRVSKQSDRPNCFVAAEVEPMQCSGGHTDQIACFHFDRNDISIFRSNMKQPAALNDKSYFIVIVPMLFIEFSEHLAQSRRRWRDIDNVRGDISSTLL